MESKRSLLQWYFFVQRNSHFNPLRPHQSAMFVRPLEEQATHHERAYTEHTPRKYITNTIIQLLNKNEVLKKLE